MIAVSDQCSNSGPMFFGWIKSFNVIADSAILEGTAEYFSSVTRGIPEHKDTLFWMLHAGIGRLSASCFRYRFEEV